MIKIHRKQTGFTMAELLVVIAIMAILVGVAVGSFTGLIGSGTGESKTYEKEAVQTAIDAYMSVNSATSIASVALGSERPITNSDVFASYMRRLPTTHAYSWTSSGSVTQR